MIPAVVLAAGGSRRLGKPKQLVRRHGQSLVRRTVTAALGAGCAPVVVVLGAHADAVRVALAGLDVVTLVNPDWRTGLASSLRGTGRTTKRPSCRSSGLSAQRRIAFHRERFPDFAHRPAPAEYRVGFHDDRTRQVCSRGYSATELRVRFRGDFRNTPTGR